MEIAVVSSCITIRTMTISPKPCSYNDILILIKNELFNIKAAGISSLKRLMAYRTRRYRDVYLPEIT